MSGLQGREANALAGVMAMVSLGMLGDYFRSRMQIFKNL